MPMDVLKDGESTSEGTGMKISTLATLCLSPRSCEEKRTGGPAGTRL